MNDRVAFLRAIRANPDDDTTRLVFADWLDEHDDPLGEFIRVQCELEPIRYRIDNPRALELHKREDELLRAHSDDWLGTDHLLTNPADFGPVCRRGFPDYACLSLDTFLTNGEALFAAHPTLREVALYGLANRCSELTMSPLLAKLDTLEIADWLPEDDAISLSVSPHLDKIGRFKLWCGGEPYFLREIVKQADTNWPREIELVQVYGGAACHDPEEAESVNNYADRDAQEANERLGRLAVRVTRPFERLFPIDYNNGHGICAGHVPDVCAGYLPNGRAAITAVSFGQWILVVFDGTGRMAEAEARESPIPEPSSSHETHAHFAALGDAAEEWRYDELKLRRGLIWVREFAVEDLRVNLLPAQLRLRVANPSPQLPQNWLPHAWADACGELRGWLEHHNFIFECDPVHIHCGDWRGSIHSS